MVCALVVSAGCRLADDPSEDAAWNLALFEDSRGTEHFASASSNPAEFFFGIMYEDARGTVTLTLNGFPIHQAGGGRRFQNGILSYSLQKSLVSGPNVFRIRIEPTTLRHGDALWFPTVRLHGRVTGDYHGDRPIPGAEITEAQVDSAYAEWKEGAKAAWAGFLRSETAWREANPDRGWEITWRSGGALDSMWAWSREHPVVVSTTFENEAGPDFSDLFLEAPVLTDTVRIRDYAMYLRDRMAARDTLALFEAFRRYYADQYIYYGVDGNIEDDRQSLLDNAVMPHADLDFGRSDIALRSWSTGRVWEVTRRGHSFFESEDAIQDVYIAEIDGELQVVR